MRSGLWLRNHAAHKLIRDRNVWGERLWTVEDRGFTSPCWVWKGSRDQRGIYGRTRWRSATWLAHRRAWVEAGRTLIEGLELDHLCRVQLCVNPDHLDQVAPAVNARRSRATKLTPEQVAEIRGRYTGAYGEISALARDFGVSRGNIRFIVQGQTWEGI